MMKHYILWIIVLLGQFYKAEACGPYYRNYLAGEYNMFRACGDNMIGTATDWDKQKRVDNCLAWARLTSSALSVEAIDEVVYHWNLSQISQLHTAAQSGKGNYPQGNRFADWIVSHQDQEIADFLLLAKTSEEVRLNMGNPWYYPTEGDDASVRLQQLIDTARSYRGKRLKDRYVVQILRALFPLHRYSECLNTWMEYQACFTKGAIRDLALGYAAGAYFHVGDRKKAEQLYLETNNYGQAYACQEKAGEYWKWMCENAPDNTWQILHIQSRISELERWHNGSEQDAQQAYREIYAQIKEVINEGRCRKMAQWYYAGAFVADKLRLPQESHDYINKAMTFSSENDLGNAIRLFYIYQTIKTAEQYNDHLESWLYPQLRWMDSLIVHNLTPEVMANIEEEGLYNHRCGISQYYWNDMMRKIVIGELVPLCIRSNYKTRALQYLNMADNRIFQLVPRTTCSYYDWDADEYQYTVMDISSFRNGTKIYNSYDYSNDYFLNLDSMGVAYVKRLAVRMEQPLCELDSFLTARSYADPQYLNDIIGTQLIGEQKYAEAIHYLQKVSRSFNRSRNVYSYCNIDPFTGKNLKKSDNAYKLHFAQKMLKLERKMKTSKNPNDRAETMLTYVRGLQSSVGKTCWPLTSFYWGYWYGIYYSSNQRKHMEDITHHADQLKEEAFALFTDDNRASKAYYDWKMFKTVATRFPHTEMAEVVRGHCDKLIDYHVKPELPGGVIRWN